MNYTTQTLSEAIAKKRGIDAFTDINHPLMTKTNWLVDDTKRMAELAWSNNIDIMQDSKACCATACVFTKGELYQLDAFYANHNKNPIAATCFAIGLALLEI